MELDREDVANLCEKIIYMLENEYKAGATAEDLHLILAALKLAADFIKFKLNDLLEKNLSEALKQ